MPVDERKGLHTVMVLYPETEEEIKENLPQYESIVGFENWLSYKDDPVTESTTDNNQA